MFDFKREIGYNQGQMEADLSDHEALIARLEKLTGPSREVDALIACAFPEICIWKLPENSTGFTAHRDGSISYLSPGNSHGTLASKFTDILDAAVALTERLLPGWEWRAEARHAEILEAVGDGEDRIGRLHIGHGSTSAIALLIALLRALPSSTPLHGEQG